MPLYRKKIVNQSSLGIPTDIRTTADNNDFFIGIDENTELYKISKADLLAGLSNSGGGGDDGDGETPSSIDKIYVSDGDNNGIFYHIGTIDGQYSWNNPVENGLTITCNGIEVGNVNLLVDRQQSYFQTTSEANSFVKFFLGGSRKLKCNYYTIRNKNVNFNYHLRNWSLQGSNNDINWVDLDVQVNNTSLSSASQWLALPVASNAHYSYFRLITTGNDSSGANYLILGEVELYGSYVP